jgi:hypothetical protein
MYIATRLGRVSCVTSQTSAGASHLRVLPAPAQRDGDWRQKGSNVPNSLPPKQHTLRTTAKTGQAASATHQQHSQIEAWLLLHITKL